MPKRRKNASFSARSNSAGAGASEAGSDPQIPGANSVRFINSEVLDPPKQGDISFVKPYIEQTLAMALEDARSFIQGAEQILLIALAKELEKLVSGGAPVPAAGGEGVRGETGDMPDNDFSKQASVNGGQSEPGAEGFGARDTRAPQPGCRLKAIESVLVSLSTFHASMADTALKSRGDR